MCTKQLKAIYSVCRPLCDPIQHYGSSFFFPLAQTALQVKCLHHGSDLSSHPHISSFWSSIYSTSLCMGEAMLQCYDFHPLHSQCVSCRLSQSHTLASISMTVFCAITHLPRSGCTSLCWYMDSVTKETQAEGRLAWLKMQLPRERGLLELGYKTNTADKQATFGADSVPCTLEIKTPCRFNTPQLNL